MEATRVPPLIICPITDTTQSWRWVEGQTPVDFSHVVDGQVWSAEIQIFRCRVEAFRAALDLTADGYLSIAIPASVAAELRSCRRIDATYQITITAPLPDLSEVWTGAVVVQEVRK